jgi:hypothetical protein
VRAEGCVKKFDMRYAFRMASGLFCESERKENWSSENALTLQKHTKNGRKSARVEKCLRYVFSKALMAYVSELTNSNFSLANIKLLVTAQRKR